MKDHAIAVGRVFLLATLLRPDGTRVSSGKAFGTSGSAAPARNASAVPT